MRQCLFPLLLILSLIISAIEIEIAVPSFVEMSQYFAALPCDIEKTLVFNLLGFCLAAIFYGPLSESFGRRKIMIAGNALLLLGAMGCVFSFNLSHLYLARFIQGTGAATSAVVVFAMISDHYSEKEAITLLGFFNAIFSLFIAIAPLLGGLIQNYWGWRGNYGVLAFISVISWILLYCYLPETKKEITPCHPLQIAQHYLSLLKDKHFLSAAIIPSLLYACYCAFIALSSFLYLETFQTSLLQYTLYQTAILCLFSLTSLFAGRITYFLGAKKIILISMLCCLLSISSLFIFNLMRLSSPWLTSFFMANYCIGFALAYPVIFAKSMSHFPHIKGIASAFIMSLRTLLMAIVIFTTGILYHINSTSLFAVMTCIISCLFILSLKLRNAFSE